MPIALGIDFEHIRQTPAYRDLDSNPNLGFNLSNVTDGLLRLFDDFGVDITFFVVSDLTETHPEVIRRIRNQGHEIASHTRRHQSLTALSDGELRDAIEGSKSDLENFLDEPVRGFRAPTCKIDERAYQFLSEAGYDYSSSVMPSVPIPGFYSSKTITRCPTNIKFGGGEIREYPVVVSPGVRLPVSGAWIRLLGRKYTIDTIKRRSRNDIVCTYSHPWEFQEMNRPLPFRCRFRTGEWLTETYRRVLSLDREFVTYSELCDRFSVECSHRIA